jgi:hypothetical protein
MRAVRILAMVMLALLYLGGTYARLSGVAFPVTGTGNQTYDKSSGTTREPLRPIITECRHIPLVKVVEISPAMPTKGSAFDHLEEFESILSPSSLPGVSTRCFSSCSDRAPPSGQVYQIIHDAEWYHMTSGMEA